MAMAEAAVEAAEGAEDIDFDDDGDGDGDGDDASSGADEWVQSPPLSYGDRSMAMAMPIRRATPPTTTTTTTACAAAAPWRWR
jgi:hypothetical protein